jgi:hypothetical protein
MVSLKMFYVKEYIFVLYLATTCLHSNAMDVEKELFLWSVLTGKQELALLFWARGKNKICK